VVTHPPKYPSTPHWPWSPTVHKDDRYHQAPEVFVKRGVIITEKLDGGNTCLWRGDVFARSTGQPATQGWFAMVKKHHAWKTANSPEDIFVYGEDLYGIHSIQYEPIREDQTYRIFAVRQGDAWLAWDDVEAHAKSLDIPTVPVLFRGSFDTVKQITEFFNDEISKTSEIGGAREGFVMRFACDFADSAFTNATSKYVRKGHVQTDEHWTRNWQPAPLIRV
jgi:hypothetical protein